MEQNGSATMGMEWQRNSTARRGDVKALNGTALKRWGEAWISTETTS